MLGQIRKEKNIDDAWAIVISTRDASKEQNMALRKFLKYSDHPQQVLNIYGSFYSVRNEAKRKILSFAEDFKRCVNLFYYVNNFPELKFLVLQKALGFAKSIAEYKELLKHFLENSEGAHVCEQKISELSLVAEKVA